MFRTELVITAHERDGPDEASDAPRPRRIVMRVGIGHGMTAPCAEPLATLQEQAAPIIAACLSVQVLTGVAQCMPRSPGVPFRAVTTGAGLAVP
jgi:hypothetical protein